MASLVAQLVKNPPAKQETLFQFLGQDDPLEKGEATHSSVLGLSCWLRWERIHLQCRRPGLDSWIGKIPWRGGMAIHSSTLAWRIPKGRGAWRATVHGFAKSRT